MKFVYKYVFILVTGFLFSCGGGGGNSTGNNNQSIDSISKMEMISKLLFYNQYHQTTVLLHEVSTPLGNIFTKATEVEFPCGDPQPSIPTFVKNDDNSFSLSKDVSVDFCTVASAGALSIPTTISGQLSISLNITDFKVTNNFAGADIDLTGMRLIDVLSIGGTVQWKQIRLKLSIVHSGEIEISGSPETRSAGLTRESYELHNSQDPSKPCVFLSNKLTDCMITLVDEIESQIPNVRYSNKLVFKYNNIDLNGFTGLLALSYFPNGNVDFMVNDWSGVLNFSDINTPPSYTADNDNGVETGNLTYCLDQLFCI